jgi:hypothetical protein
MYHISRKKHPTITQTIEGKERVTELNFGFFFVASMVVGKKILIYGRAKDIEIIDSFQFKLLKCQNNSKTN